MSIIAKKIDWKHTPHNCGDEWMAEDLSFYIEEHLDETEDERYSAYLSENKCETFSTVDEAKKHCQDNLNEFIKKYAVLE